MRDLAIFQIMEHVSEEYVLESLPIKTMYYEREHEVNHTFFSKKMRMGIASVLVFALISLVGSPVVANTLPFIGNVFEYLQSKLSYSGMYSHYATEIGEAVEDQGITVAISEAYCDGTYLFVSYKIQSENLAERFSGSNSIQTQFEYDARNEVSFNGQTRQLDSSGIAGLEGEYVDADTFVGVDTFFLKGESFPETFKLNIEISSLGSLSTGSSAAYSINGNWDFKIPLTVNTEDIIILDINASNQEHTIDQVVISPVMITVYTSYPDIYWGTLRYEVIAYSNLSDKNITREGYFDVTSGITKIPRYRVDETLDLYVIDHATLEAITGPRAYTRSEIEECAIVHTQIKMQ